MSEKELRSLKEDEYFLFYAMMVNSLRTDDVFSGIDKSLFLLKEYLHSENISIHKKTDGFYNHYVSDTSMNYPNKNITSIVNEVSTLLEKKEMYNIDLNLSETIKNMMLIHLSTVDNSYILSINNCSDSRMNSNFWNRLKDTMQVILKRTESYEKNMRAIGTDLLTGLDNRNSYELRMEKINETDTDLVYGLFDLFRLKYINDNFSHATGDIYIKEVANILNRYWPKQKIEIVDDEEQIIPTGHSIYRVGGDEFVLITTKEYLELVKMKASLATEETKMLDLGIGKSIPIGLNFGIVEHLPGEKMKETFMKADALMSEDKRKMYKQYKLERRK